MSDNIQKSWEEFRSQVMDPGAGPTQVEEMRLAFFAGHVSFMRLVHDGGPDIIGTIAKELEHHKEEFINYMKENWE